MSRRAAHPFTCSSAPLWTSSRPRTDSWRTSCRTWRPRRSRRPTGKPRSRRSSSGTCGRPGFLGGVAQVSPCAPKSLSGGGSPVCGHRPGLVVGQRPRQSPEVWVRHAQPRTLGDTEAGGAGGAQPLLQRRLVACQGCLIGHWATVS